MTYERMLAEAFRENILFIADFGIPKEQYRRNNGFHLSQRRTDKIDDVLPYFIIGEFHNDTIGDIYNSSHLRIDENYLSRDFKNDSFKAFDCLINNRMLRGNYQIVLIQRIKDRYGIWREGERKITDAKTIFSGYNKMSHYKKISTFRAIPDYVTEDPKVIPFYTVDEIATCTAPDLIQMK